MPYGGRRTGERILLIFPYKEMPGRLHLESWTPAKRFSPQKISMNAQITQWHPIRELEDLQQRLASAWNLSSLRSPSQEESLTVAQWTPRVDISEDDKEFVIKAELPEMKKEDVKVTLEDGTLTISGERKLEKEEKNQTYHRIEREYGTFFRSFLLPIGVSGDNVSADFKDGVLKIRLPKDAKSASAKTIEIKTA
jgi:HSP20 family protein